MSVGELLKTVPLFHHLSRDHLAEVLRHGKRESWPASRLVFAEGAQPDCLYVILSGSVKIYKVDPTGTEVELATLKKGDFFGELALLEGGPRSASVATLEPCEFFVLGRDEFIRLLLDSPRSLLGLFSDICARIRAFNEKFFQEALQKQDLLLQVERERYQLLAQVATVANEATTFREAMQIAVERICTYTEWPVGHVFVPSAGGTGELVSSCLWHLKNPERFESFRKVSETTRVGPGVGLPGRVWADGEAVWIQDLAQDPTCPRARQAREAGLGAAFGFPVVADKEVVAVLEFFFEKPGEPDELLWQAVSSIGIQLGQGVERRRYEEQLRHSAFYDALTGLPNRALFVDRLSVSLGRAKRRKDYLFAVMFTDLDRFKLVNDSLGHLFGDRLLVEIGRRLQACLRATDTVARLGGDEFAILLDDVKKPNEAVRTVERIRKKLLQPCQVNGQEVFTSASMGIALSSTGYDDPEGLLRDADTAMYRAKQKGRGLHELFDSSMHQQAMKLLLLETDLRKALDRQELAVHYQPILSLETGEIAAFEALLRWSHPERGLVSPDEFIGVAEDTGLIIPITHWVLHEVCRQLQKWQVQSRATLDFSVSVNLTSKHLEKPDLAKEITAIISEHRLEPRNLALEITERQIMRNPEPISRTLLELDDYGVRTYIDDFGTGYSSLSYLANFRVHALKVDRSFVAKLKGDYRGAAVALAIISLAQNLGLEVIAEGVETAEQADYLHGVKCGYAQGYYFFKPLDEEGVSRLLTQRAHPPQREAAPLRRFDLFEGLQEEQLAEILRNCEERTIDSGTLIIRQGQVGKEVYLLQEGSVSVYRGEGDAARVLAVLQAPSLVGEMALMDRSRIRTANVKALDRLRVLAISIDSLISLIKRFPSLREKLRQLIAART